MHHKYENLHFEHFININQLNFRILQWSRYCKSTFWMSIKIFQPTEVFSALCPLKYHPDKSLNIDSFFKIYLSFYFKRNILKYTKCSKGSLRQFVSVGTPDHLEWIGAYLSSFQPAQLKTKPTWAVITVSSILLRIINLVMLEDIMLMCFVLRSLITQWSDEMWSALHLIHEKHQYLNNVGFIYSINIV